MSMHPLRRFLNEEGLSVKEFIAKYNIGLSRSFVTMVSLGSANLAKGTAVKIANATGIPAELLMFPELEKKCARYKKEQGHDKANDAHACKCVQNQQVA